MKHYPRLKKTVDVFENVDDMFAMAKYEVGKISHICVK